MKRIKGKLYMTYVFYPQKIYNTLFYIAWTGFWGGLFLYAGVTG